MAEDPEVTVATAATDFAPYWLSTTNHLHRVKGVLVVWENPPRIVLEFVCRAGDVKGRQVRGLTHSAERGSPCIRCFGYAGHPVSLAAPAGLT